MPGRKWTDEQRRELSEAMKQRKPWEKSTGPKTEDGKDRASFNSYKHGNQSHNAHEMRALLKAQNTAINQIEALLKISKYLE